MSRGGVRIVGGMNTNTQTQTTGTTRWSVRHTYSNVIHRIEGATLEEALLGLVPDYSENYEVEEGTHFARIVFVSPTNGERIVVAKFAYQANN